VTLRCTEWTGQSRSVTSKIRRVGRSAETNSDAPGQPLSLAIILCACDFNYIRRCDSQPICATNRACFSSGDFSLAAFSELFGPGQVCYWKTWFSGSNWPCSSASILDHRLLWSIEFFWVLTRRLWSGWKQALTVVTPDTVVGWHRGGCPGGCPLWACDLQSSGSDGPEANFSV